jgi:hypothetical protein
MRVTNKNSIQEEIKSRLNFGNACNESKNANIRI